MEKRTKAFSRRTLLRGAGCTMALPWLESLDAFAADPATAEFPKRFGVVFLGCGINEDFWGATGDGADMKLAKSLSPLEPLKSKINVIDGLYVKAMTGQGILRMSGIFSRRNRSRPTLASPIAFSMPPRVSTMRVGSLPGRSSRVIDLVTNAPRRDRSIKSAYSWA